MNPRTLSRLWSSIGGALLSAGSILSSDVTVAAPPQLPVPCVGGACSSYNYATKTSTSVTQFVTSGHATATQTGSTLTVNQTSNQAILNWASFNIGAGGKVVFDQPAATSIALNKIYQASPSSIFGTLTANGQIYLINANGFVFGSGSTVNVGGLLASSLGLYNGDAELSAGLLSPITQGNPAPALASDGRTQVLDGSGNPVLDANGNPEPVQVLVQAGAQLTAADGGRLMLAGQTVTNAGSLAAPDGQVALAAGQSAYLTASTDPSVRGLIIEVTGQGTVTNQAAGALSAPRGNVSLVGLAVNQNGRISATTAVSANGTVTLEAGNGTPANVGSGCQSGETLCLNQGGTLTIGNTSDIEIDPDASGGTAVVGQAQLQSGVKLLGEQVDINGGRIVAPDGKLSVVAAANPDLGLHTEGNAAAQLRIASGTTIDLSGSTVQLPMASNLITIQLRGNELEDDPDQRNGALHGQTVIADVRNGKPAIISQSSWQSALEDVQENILQRTAAGGSASFESEGDVVVASGAIINVSGGAWDYAAGVTQTSDLIAAGGQLYNLSTASPLVTYTGVLNPTYTQTYNGFGIQVTEPTPGLGHYQSGYSQGFSAGTVTFAAPAMYLQGALIGHATNGLYQRSPGTIPASSLAALVGGNDSTPATPTGADAIAEGGTLVIGDATPPFSGGLPYFFAPTVNFAATGPAVTIVNGSPLPAQPLTLTPQYLTSGGFSQTQIYSDYGVTIPTGLPLNLGAGGSLLLAAPTLTVDSSIQALGGSIGLQSVRTADYAPNQGRTGIQLGTGVTLDVQGQWTNDSMDAPASPLTTTYQNGGSIDLSLTSSYSPSGSGGQLVLGNDVSLLANGGAWIQSNNAVVGGSGGSITLDASPYQSALQIGTDVTLAAFGVQGAAGGSFSLAAPRLAIGSGTAWANAQRIDDLTAPGAPLQLGRGLFSEDGFSSVSLTATAPVLAGAASSDLLTVLAGTNIDASAQSLQLNAGYLRHGTGGTAAGLATPQTLPIADQSPEAIALQVQPAATDPSNSIHGDLDIATGSSLLLNPNVASSIDLSSQGNLLIGGVLRVSGGTISAQIQQPSLNDPGYVANQRLELESGGVLDVSGAAVMTPNPLQLDLGTVLPGGSIELTTDRGELIADAGSTINFAGGSAELQQQSSGATGGYSAALVGSAGGTLSLQSVESVSLRGAILGSAGASSAGALQGGSLSLQLLPVAATAGTPFPNVPDTIQLQTSTAGLAPSASNTNTAILGVTQLEQSGIDSVTLENFNVSSGVIALNSSTPLSIGGSITLDAPTLSVMPGINAVLNAPYVLLTNGLAQKSAGAAVQGNGSLSIHAQQIGLSGFVAFQGVDATELVSSGDVELLPVAGGQQTGELNAAGAITIDAARVYPATLTSFTINDPGGSVVVEQNGVSPGAPLSAGGSLSIQAQSITSSGTLLAPFGQIALTAADSLSLEKGSVTSVSGAGELIPFGQTEFGGSAWIYQAGNATSLITGIPGRVITLSAPQVTMASGATVDLRGGGDLVASEWVPGLGGSIDALSASNAASAGWYAVMPSTEGQYAGYDVHAFTGSSVGVGSSVYLSGITGLSAGVYPLLPASYALLPGAVLIQVQPGFQSFTPGMLGSLANGAPVIAGYLTFGNSGLRQSAGYEGFAVYPGSYAQSLAQYTLSNASSFFAGAVSTTGQTPVSLPADAGLLQIAVGSSLNALGNVLTAAATGGSPATIDLYTTGPSAITVAASSSGSPGANGIVVAAPVLQSWNAGDLVLGGALSADGTSIDVTANTVTIASGAQVTAGQILAVANQGIDVQSGAVLATTSGINNTTVTTTPAEQSLNLTGSGTAGAALLAISDTELPIAVRTGVGGGAASIDIEGALQTHGAVAVDAPGAVTIAGSIKAPGASWSLASDSIAFVGNGSSSTDTLQITPALLTELQGADAIRLSSAGPIDLTTPVLLGSSGLAALTLSAAAINNAGTTSTFSAQTVNLQGVASGSQSPSAGTGTLEIVTQNLSIGPGTLVLNGNATTTLQASAAVTGSGSGDLIAAGNVTVSAAELTASSGSATELSVPDGTLQIVQAGSAAQPSALGTSLGGNLTLSAGEIQDAGSIIVPGGNIALQATGALTLASTASINAAGITQTAIDQTFGAPGGLVNLSAGGDLTLSPGSNISVSGAGSAPAGSLSLSSGGTLTLGGTLAASAANGAIGGNLSISANQLTGGLPALAASLSAAGFSNQIALEVGTGDLDLSAGSSLTANRLVLTADSGSIDIAGTLSAPSAGLRGSIGLFAANDVTLESTAVLQANGTASNARGGEIELSSTGGTLNLDAGSLISANGTAQMGSLLLRAPAIVNTGDVAISSIGSNLSGVGQLIVEPVLPVFQSNADFTLDFSSIQNTVTSYLTLAQTAIPARFQNTGAASLLLEPGVVVDATGDLTLSQSLDLYQLQLGAPIDLTVRASGSIEIDGAITDGINYFNFPPTLSGTPSSSLRFVAGANLSSADPLATVAGSAANLVLGSNPNFGTVGLVQTGTGDIDLVASGDVQFAPGASASTVGLPAASQVPLGSGTGGLELSIDFPTDGGNLRIQAGQDVIQQVAGNSLVNSASSWQLRNLVGDLGEYGVNLNEILLQPWTLATFGGGDLAVTAGQDIVNVSAAVAGSTAVTGSAAAGYTQTHYASGGLSVQAGRDITTGQFFQEDGIGTLDAGRSFATNVTFGANSVGSLIYLGNAQLSAWAEGDINIAGVLDPTVLVEPGLSGGTLYEDTFFSYGANSSFSAQSSAGNVNLNNSGVSTFIGPSASSEGQLLLDAPASLSLVALRQNLQLTSGATLYPSDTGQLLLFAGGNIIGGSFIMLDAPDNAVPTAASPGSSDPILGVEALTQGGAESPYAFDSGRHASDPNPALIVAGGSIENTQLAIPKPARVESGLDIVNLTYRGQNLGAGDMTLIDAGRDFIDSISFNAGGGVASSVSTIQVGGPGSVDLIAGRDVNFGFSAGLVTVGNLLNPNLSTSAGAGITVAAGLGESPNDPGFLQHIIEPSASYQQQLVSYVESLTGQSGLSSAQADREFAGLAPNQQQALVDSVFFQELNQSGIEANTTNLGYSRGYAAIDALFPGTPTTASATPSNAYSGDLDLTYSRISTLSGGGIALLVPGGSINVGLANPPAASATAAKPPSDLGIVAQGAGDVDIYALGSVNVNASRIFTLGGGNILIWSQLGSIDAGNGAKTSLSLPPPTYTVDQFGNVQLVFNAAVAGSGIRTIQTSATEAAGNVDLIAPIGSVNAGDAGIGAAGNINIAAVTVTGVSNINFGGSATGVPAVVSNLSATVSSASSAATSATTSANAALESTAESEATAAPLAQAALSYLEVFVTGLGEENCKPDDLECLRRQKHE